MKRRSRSNTSTCGSVTSPCTCRTSPHSAIASSAGQIFSIEVTPASECVVAPAGIELRADDETAVLRRKYFFRRGAVRQVQRHQRLEAQPGGQRRENARAVLAECRLVVIGGLRFGMTTARANWRAVNGSTAARCLPSRRCRCQSSGRRSVSDVGSAWVKRGPAGAGSARRHRRASAPRSVRRSR